MSFNFKFLQQKPRNEQLLAVLPNLRRYARALNGDRVLADDLVQDCIAKACEKWDLWQPSSDLRAWMFTIMHNIFYSQARYNSYRHYDSLDEVELSEPIKGINLEDQVIIRLDLDKALQQLPAEQRMVLLLVVLEDMSYDQVAHTLGLPIGTVMSRLSRARKKLSEILKQDTIIEGGAPTKIANTKVNL